MTAPRPVIPGLFLFLTRRCTQRQFLLRPDVETNNAFVYCLAEAAQRFGMDVLLSQMMSNHQHTAVYDALGREVEFREHFHKMMARSQNALRGRWENFWSAEEVCVTELLTREENLVGLMAVNRDLIGQAETFDHTDRVVLDKDSSESPVHGQQGSGALRS